MRYETFRFAHAVETDRSRDRRAAAKTSSIPYVQAPGLPPRSLFRIIKSVRTDYTAAHSSPDVDGIKHIRVYATKIIPTRRLDQLLKIGIGHKTDGADASHVEHTTGRSRTHVESFTKHVHRCE